MTARRLPLRAACSLIVAFVGLTSPPPVVAASFGVPGVSPAGPDGWFILVGKDAVDEGMSDFFGDISRELRLNIEVTGTNLDICIFDPGIYDAALGPGQRDFEFVSGAGRSSMHYELFDPSGASIKLDDTTFGPDCVGGDILCAGGARTDDSLWCFYQSSVDGAVAPGVYQLLARMVDGPGLDQHANLFGVTTTPDYDVYTYYATVGHSTVSGAGLGNGFVRLHPWIVRASAGSDPVAGDACAVDIATYDFDTPTPNLPPPQGEMVTRLGFPELFPTSGNGQLKIHQMYNLAGLNAGDDHGIHTLEFRSLAGADGVLESNLVPPLPAPLDFNAFSFQVYDTGQLNPSLFYPIAPPDPLMATYVSRRLYLPTNAAAAPVKEYLAHAITNVPPGGRYTQSQVATLMIELRIENPTSYDLRNIVGQTVVPAAAELADPVGVTAFGGMGRMAAATGRVIDFSFTRLRAGQSAGVRYNVDYTPGTPGFFFVTGDGSDFAGGASPTWAMWDTATPAGTIIASAETASPCMIQTEVEVAPCAVGITPVAPARVCLGEPFTLDGTSPTQISCPGGALEYRWSGPGLSSPLFDPSPLIMTSNATPGLAAYSLEVRCAGMTTCASTQNVAVDVSAAAKPVADAGGDRAVATCDVPFPIGVVGDPASYSYTWTSTSPILTLVDDPTVSNPNFVQVTPGVYDLTLDVVSLVDGSCADRVTVMITISNGTPTGSLGNELRAVRAGGDVDLRWTLGIVAPDRYNVHRAVGKTELDKGSLPLSYTAAILNPGPVLAGTYLDVGANPPSVYYYEVYGRDCAGLSDIR